MSEDGSDTPTPNNPGKIRLPTDMEIKTAVEAVPTVRDDQKPDAPLPDYLKPSTATVELNINEADESAEPTEKMSAVAGFTEQSSADPTEKEMKAISLSKPVIEPQARPDATERSQPPWLVIIAMVLVVAGVAIFMLLR